MAYKNRIHYRNTSFLHIGHLQTIFYNSDIAERNKGVCCVIVDDRQNPERINEIQGHFDYLKVKHTNIISVRKYIDPIMIYTKDLVDSGNIYLNHSTNTEFDQKQIIKHIENPDSCHYPDGRPIHFQLRLKAGYRSPTIGYTREINGKLTLIFLFDYIIKVLDYLLEITDVVTTSSNDITDVQIAMFFEDKLNITYHSLPTYKIDGFKYSKRDWPDLLEDDPRLLTLPGLKLRHIPAEVLYAFYLHAMQMQEIKVSYLDTLLRSYLNHKCSRAFGIVNPVRVDIVNWKNKNTEYVCKPKFPATPEGSTEGNLYLSPLSDHLYIDKTDFGFENDNNLSKNREVRLKYNQVISINCTDVEIDKGIKSIRVFYTTTPSKTKRCIHWVSSEWGEEPIKVRYYLYNWFYTGMNSLLPVKIREGYIENEPFNDLSQIYQLERTGYFVYDAVLSKTNGVPCFIRICGIKN